MVLRHNATKRERKHCTCELAVDVCVLLSLSTHASPVRPNILLVHLDDMGYGDISVYSTANSQSLKLSKTPWIDRLAYEGTRFTSFYASACVCTPSRAGLLTGRYPIRTGTFPGVLGPDDDTGLSLNEITLAKWLKKEANYRTYAVGKWHLGHLPNFLPEMHGFDKWTGMPYSHDYCPCPQSLTHTLDNSCRDFDPPCPLMNGSLIVQQPALLFQLTEYYSDAAIEFMQQAKDSNEPFFLYYACHHLHHPQYVADVNIEKSAGVGGRDDALGDAAWEMDKAVGKLTQYIRSAGLKDNTYVILTSDNGAALIYGELAGSNFPLRCGKGTTWEGGQRVPMIIWGGKSAISSVRDDIVAAMDVFPTVAKLVNIGVPTDRIIDGVDFSWMFLPTASGAMPVAPANKRDTFIFYSLDPGTADAVRIGNYKIHFHTHVWFDNDFTKTTCRPAGIKVGRQKTPLVYDLSTDIGESKPLKHSDPLYAEVTLKAKNFLADHKCNHVGQEGCGLTEPTHCLVHYGASQSIAPWPPKPFLPWSQSMRSCCPQGLDIVLYDWTNTDEFACVKTTSASGEACPSLMGKRQSKIDSLCNPTVMLYPECKGRAVCSTISSSSDPGPETIGCALEASPATCPKNTKLKMCPVGMFQCRWHARSNLDIVLSESVICVRHPTACANFGGLARGARACGFCLGETAHEPLNLPPVEEVPIDGQDEGNSGEYELPPMPDSNLNNLVAIILFSSLLVLVLAYVIARCILRRRARGGDASRIIATDSNNGETELTMGTRYPSKVGRQVLPTSAEEEDDNQGLMHTSNNGNGYDESPEMKLTNTEKKPSTRSKGEFNSEEASKLI